MEEYDKARMAARIKLHAERRGLGPLEIAVGVGAGSRTAERWLSGESAPQRRHQIALARFFDIPIEELRPDLKAEEETLKRQVEDLREEIQGFLGEWQDTVLPVIEALADHFAIDVPAGRDVKQPATETESAPRRSRRAA